MFFSNVYFLSQLVRVQTGSHADSASELFLCSCCSLGELVRHEENGMVFDTETQLTGQLQVGTGQNGMMFETQNGKINQQYFDNGH